MQAFSIELLQARGWKRQPAIYWTLDDARRTGERLLRRKAARQVRILPLEISVQPVVCLPEGTVTA